MSFSGTGVARRKVYHPLEDQNGDLVGPGAWDLLGGSFTTVGAKFGKGYQATGAVVLATGTDIVPYDNSDTAKTLVAFHWTPLGLGVDQVPYYFSNAAFSGDSLHMQYDNGSPGTLQIQRNRVADLPGQPGQKLVLVTSNPIDITSGAPISVVGYLNSASDLEGKVFVNGTDITASTSSASATTGANNHKRVLISNHRNAALPANVVDDFVVLQDPSLADALVATWVPLYKDTQGFGHFQIFGSLSVTSGVVGTSVTLTGSGFGVDVELTLVGGGLADVQVRVNQGSVTFDIPNVALGVYDLAIKNVAADVTWTESAAFTVLPTLETINVDVFNLEGAAVVGALVSIFDASNVLQDSGLTDANGRFTTALVAAPYKVIATKDGVAGGNSLPVTVVSG